MSDRSKPDRRPAPEDLEATIQALGASGGDALAKAAAEGFPDRGEDPAVGGGDQARREHISLPHRIDLPGHHRLHPGPLRDLDVGRGGHPLFVVQGGSGLDNTLPGGVEALGPLPHPVLSAGHVDSHIDERQFS